MLLTKVQRTTLWPSEAKPRTRFALGVLVAGVTGFAALTALLPTKHVQAIDQAITVRFQANADAQDLGTTPVVFEIRPRVLTVVAADPSASSSGSGTARGAFPDFAR